MATYAKLDKSKTVVDLALFEDELESRGIAWLANNLGGSWLLSEKQNGEAPHKNKATIGSKYDKTLDAFIPEKVVSNFVLDTETYSWTAPTPVPDPLLAWTWDNDAIEWVQDL